MKTDITVKQTPTWDFEAKVNGFTFNFSIKAENKGLAQKQLVEMLESVIEQLLKI